MRPAALDIAEGVGAHPGRLAARRRKPRLDEIGKPVAERARAGKLHIAVGIDLASAAHQLRPDLLAGLVADAFAHRDLAAPELGVDRLDIGEEGFRRERHLGEIDEMRRRPVRWIGAIARRPASERGGGGEEAGVPPHDHVDLDAAEARIVERVPHQRERDVARG